MLCFFSVLKLSSSRSEGTLAPKELSLRRNSRSEGTHSEGTRSEGIHENNKDKIRHPCEVFQVSPTSYNQKH